MLAEISDRPADQTFEMPAYHVARSTTSERPKWQEMAFVYEDILDARETAHSKRLLVCTSRSAVALDGACDSDNLRVFAYQPVPGKTWRCASWSADGDRLAGGHAGLWRKSRAADTWEAVDTPWQVFDGVGWDDEANLFCWGREGAAMHTPQGNRLPLTDLPVKTFSRRVRRAVAAIFDERLSSSLPRLFSASPYRDNWCDFDTRFLGSPKPVTTCIAFGKDEDLSLIACGDREGNIQVDKSWGRRVFWCTPKFDDAVTALAWSSGALLASASNKGAVHISRYETGDVPPHGWYDKMVLVAELHGHAAAVEVLAWAPGDQTLASGCRAGTIRLWQVANNGVTCRHKLSHDNGAIRGIRFAPQEPRRFISFTQTALRVWDDTDDTPSRPSAALDSVV